MNKTTELKAQELMIGDWVIAQPDEDICGKGCGAIVDRITAIYDEDGVMSVRLKDFDYPVAVELLTPLPLTIELLEKNGWKRDKSPAPAPFSCALLNEKFVIRYHRLHGLDMFEKRGSGLVALSGQRVNIYIQYVHQLQHIFKLCEINKELVV